MRLRLNLGCGTFRASPPWVNVDIVNKPEHNIVPDVVASIADLPFDDGSTELILASHVLEHLAIQDGPPSTLDRALCEVRRVLGPIGRAAFVCPDVYKALHGWKQGSETWELVDACLEGPDGGLHDPDGWTGIYHAWNCTEARMLGFVRQTFPDAVAVPITSSALDGFPVVSRALWQAAVVTRP